MRSNSWPGRLCIITYILSAVYSPFTRSSFLFWLASDVYSDEHLMEMLTTHKSCSSAGCLPPPIQIPPRTFCSSAGCPQGTLYPRANCSLLVQKVPPSSLVLNTGRQVKSLESGASLLAPSSTHLSTKYRQNQERFIQQLKKPLAKTS